MVEKKNSLTDNIMKEEYYTVGDNTVICLITTYSGYEIVGSSFCINPRNFSFEIGKSNAKRKALALLSEMEAYRIKCDLSDTYPFTFNIIPNEENPSEDPASDEITQIIFKPNVGNRGRLIFKNANREDVKPPVYVSKFTGFNKRTRPEPLTELNPETEEVATTPTPSDSSDEEVVETPPKKTTKKTTKKTK